nr:DUF308 domain-containing protein [Methylobacterium gnaphalii]
MSAVLARNWWLVALRGVFAILFGVLAFAAPQAFLLALALYFAAYMLVDGGWTIASAIRSAQKHERYGFLLLEGIVDIIVGLAAALIPAAAIWAFVLLVATWALVTGALMIAAAFRLHLHYGRWWLGLGGVISVLFGLALAINPGMSAIVLAFWMGAYSLAFGVMLLFLAFNLRGRHATSR